MVTRRESLIREGILNPDGSRKGDRDRFPKLIAEGILPGGGFGISPPANTQLGQPRNTNLGQPRPVLQPPMASVSGGVNSFPNAFDPGSQLGNGTIRRQPGVYGIPDPGGLQNLPGANQGINLPISIGNNPSLNPIQDQMFRPPMQQPVQNQMPVANSFLEQLQQSAGLLQNQVTALQPPVVNNVPQNRFVGNQFQMPFGMGQPTPFGGNYGSGGFNLPYNPGSYTPGAFNQYGNIGTTGGIDNIINSLLGPGRAEGRDGDRGAFGNQGNGISTEVIGGRTFRFNEDGTVNQVDPESIDARFATFMDKILGYTPTGLTRGLLGLNDNPNDVYDRIKEQYGEETALTFSRLNAEAINKEMNTNPDARRAEVEANFRETATQAEKDRLDMTDRERGITNRESTGISRTPGDAGTARDAAGFSGGANPMGGGFTGGR